MATAKVSPLSCPSNLQPPTISSQQIARYAEITSLICGLESQKETLRSELLALHTAGAEQELDSPYLLNFVETERRTVDWKAQSLALAEKLYGLEKAASWKAKVEQSAPVQSVTQVRVKPNAAFAAGLKKPAAATSLHEMATPVVVQ
jgi:hypothetical protein